MDIIKDFNEAQGYVFKHRFALFLSLLNVLVVVIAVSFIVSTGKILQGDEAQKPQLSVSGEGRIFVKPDIATFMVTVITNGARIGETQNQNSTRSNAIIDFLKKNNVQDKDLKTISYSVEPQFQYDNGRPCPIISGSVMPCPATSYMPPKIISYEVRSSLQVKVRDLNKVDDLLQGVISAGGNEVGSVVFSVDDEKTVMAQARAQAIEDAKQKARILAQSLGVRLTKISGFSESGASPIYYTRSMDALKAGLEGAPTPQVQPGEQEIQSNVTITYEFR